MFSLNWFLGLIPSWIPWFIIVSGAAIFIFEMVFGMIIPVLYRLPTRMIAIIVISLGCYVEGRQDVLINAKQEIQEAKVEQVVVTKYIVKKYKEKRKKLNHDYAKIADQITTKDDRMCTLPESFVSVFNNAATDSISSTTKRTDGTASGIELSAAEKTIVENYELYHRVAEQLKALQEWIREQQQLNP